MAIILGDLRLLWGTGNNLPSLPDGYGVWQREGEWVMAVSPNCQWYYVSDKPLFPRMDTANPIHL